METYYAYLRGCVNFNERNLVDPAHDEMEWNHTLPQCIFKGHGPGQWLTIRQHAIASALQTLAFNKKCICPWHHKHLPDSLKSLVNPYFVEGGRKVGELYGKQNGDTQGKYLLDNRLGLFDPRYEVVKSEWSRRGLETQRDQELGLFGDRSQWVDTYAENGRAQGLLSYENKTGLFSQEGQRRCREANKQMWVSTIDGLVSTAAGVAAHNKSIGGTGKDKIKLPEQ